MYAVTSPSGDAPRRHHGRWNRTSGPVFTLTPAAISGDTVTFAFTESEAGATVECRLDAAAFAPATARWTTPGWPPARTRSRRGPPTPWATSARRLRTPGPSTSPSPRSRSRFPTVAGAYSDTAFNAGCGTASTGDVCGLADDDTSVTAVSVSLRRISTGLWWNGASFSASSETFLAATGTTDWSYAIARRLPRATTRCGRAPATAATSDTTRAPSPSTAPPRPRRP